MTKRYAWRPRIGQRVFHMTYGYGTTVYETLNAESVCVYFDRHGLRLGLHTVSQLRPITPAERTAEIGRDRRFQPQPKSSQRRRSALRCA